MIRAITRLITGFYSLLVGLRLTMINFIRRPVTIQYPWHRDDLPQRSRGVPMPWDYFDAENTAAKSLDFAKSSDAPCTLGCPALTDARAYVTLAGEGRFDDAVRLLKNTYPFSGCLGRICSAPCEKTCNRNFSHTTITIRQIKRFLYDYDHALAAEKRIPLCEHPVPLDKEEVAIIGAGPAGVACATDLAKLGYRPTVFEKFSVPGGYLYTGIPAYCLPREVILDEVKAVEALGVTFKYNTEIGKDLSLDGISARGFKAIFIGAGALKPVRLNLPGEDLDGVVPAEYFLEDLNLGRTPKIGKKVAVIGGGFTAMDTCRSARRLGAEATVLYRRTEKEMPAELHEVHDAKEEGVNFEFLVAPLEIIGENGKVTGMKFVRTRLGDKDRSGRRRPVPIEGSEFVFPCDTVYTAISRSVDLPWLPERIQKEKWGTIKVDWDTGATSMNGVFAGGDVTLGALTVIAAIAAGKRAATGIDAYLSKKAGREPLRRLRPEVSAYGLT